MGSHSAMQHQNQHPDVSVFIKNLNEVTDDKTLYELFAEFGTIVSCKLAYDERGHSKGYAFVQYECEESARAAIEKVNGMLVDNKCIYVGKFIPRKGRNKERDEKNLYTNLYVKNFGNDFTEEQLRQLFEPFGEIKSHKIMTNMEGHSKGFGFVAFEKADFAEEALRKLSGKPLGSYKLYVARAQKKAERQQELQRQFEEQEERKRRANSHGLNLYVKNLDDSITDEHLRREFSLYGPISSARVMTDSSGRSKGFGFVRFVSPVDACFAAAGLNGRIFGVKPLYVSLAQRREERRALLVAQHMRQRLQATESLYATSKNTYFRPRVVPSHQRLHVSGAMPQQSSRSQMRICPSSHWPTSTPYNASDSPLQSKIGQSWRNSCLTTQPQTQRMGTPKSQCSLRYMSSMGQQMGICPVTPSQSQNQIQIQSQNQNQSQNHNSQSPTPSQLLPMPLSLPKSSTPPHIHHVQMQVPGQLAMPVQVQVHPIASADMLSVQQYNSYMSIPSSVANDTVTAGSFPPNVTSIDNIEINDDKQIIGEHIYYIVEKLYPQLAGKITGMLLEMDNSDLWYLLNEPDALHDKIEEAYQVYKDYVKEMRGSNIDTD